MRHTTAVFVFLEDDNLDTANVAYDLAGLYALEGKKSEAITVLIDAVEHGLSAKNDLDMAKELDLKYLQGDPRFETVLANARRRAAAAQAAK
jgi:hypothetical protein